MKGRRVLLAGLLVALGAAVGVVIVLPMARACGEAEEREFVAITHFEGRQLEPEGHLDADSCMAMFETSQSVEAVVEHYRKQLSDAGWTGLDVVNHSGADVRGDRVSSIDVIARSGEMYVIVYVGSYPDSEVTHVTVHVSDE